MKEEITYKNAEAKDIKKITYMDGYWYWRKKGKTYKENEWEFLGGNTVYNNWSPALRDRCTSLALKNICSSSMNIKIKKEKERWVKEPEFRFDQSIPL